MECLAQCYASRLCSCELWNASLSAMLVDCVVVNYASRLCSCELWNASLSAMLVDCVVVNYGMPRSVLC